MFKWFLVLVNFMGIMLFNLFFQGEAGVSLSAPQSITGGDEFQVTVTLNKGNLSSFSRFLQGT